MRELAPDLTVDSAGTGGWHVGDAPYGPMQQAAAARGIDLSNLRARQFVPADFDRFDVIVAMDRQNQSDIEMHRPLGNATHLQLLDTQDVPDPYYTRDFDGALDVIECAVRRLLADISDRPDR